MIILICKSDVNTMEKYADDPCTQFSPKASTELSDKDFNMIAKMHKAISILQWEMEVISL